MERAKAGHSWCLLVMERKAVWRGALSIVRFMNKRPSLGESWLSYPRRIFPPWCRLLILSTCCLMTTRNKVLSNRFSGEAELFLNLVVWSVSTAWLTDRLGSFLWEESERWKLTGPWRAEKKSLSEKLMSKAILRVERVSVTLNISGWEFFIIL